MQFEPQKETLSVFLERFRQLERESFSGNKADETLRLDILKRTLTHVVWLEGTFEVWNQQYLGLGTSDELLDQLGRVAIDRDNGFGRRRDFKRREDARDKNKAKGGAHAVQEDGRGSVVCFKCGRPGHIAPECRFEERP